MHGNSFLKCSFIALAISSTVFLFFAPSWGAEWAISPRISAVEEYNDNILFSRKGQELDDFVTYVRPRVEGTYRTERLRLSLDSGLSTENYLDHNEFDTIDHDHRMALYYGVSRNLNLRTGGYFRADTTLETELLEEGLLVDREDRTKFGGNLGFKYAFSTAFFLSGDWTRRYSKYETLDDRESDTLKLAPTYVLSPKTNVFLHLDYTDTEYDRPGESKILNYVVRPSFRHEFAKTYYVSGGAGYRYTEDKTGSTEERTEGFDFDLSFHRDWKRLMLALLASRNQYSTVDGVSVERGKLTLKGIYRFTDRLKSSITAAFRRNHVEGGTNDSDYFTVSPALSYQLTPTISLRGSVDYSEYYYEEDGSRDRDRFRARLFLTFAWPKLWSGT